MTQTVRHSRAFADQIGMAIRSKERTAVPTDPTANGTSDRLIISAQRRRIVSERIEPVRRTSDHANTHTFEWRLTTIDREGTLHVVAAFPRQWSIQTSAPCVILGSNDDRDWFPILTFEEAGIRPAPFPVRSIRPICGLGADARVVLFITDN